VLDFTRVLTQLWEFYAMNSIVNEKYSSMPLFYLFSFLLFLHGTAISQEVLWSTPGVGERPSLSVQGAKLSDQLVLISSPFGSQVKAVKLESGEKYWVKKLLERVSYSTLALTNAVVIQGDQGTVWALKSADGEEVWVKRALEPLDYPMGPPRFREQAVFTISHRGVIRKRGKPGDLAGTAQRDNRWGDRLAETVPLRSSQKQLSYLDQSGRMTVHDPESLELLASYDLSPDDDDVLAGAASEDGELAWVVQLPGSIHAVRTRSGERVWSASLGTQDGLWSERSELLAVPSLLSWDDDMAVLVVTRDRSVIFSSKNGARLASHLLPSAAVNTPAYDSEAGRWWILCRNHVVSYDRVHGWRDYSIPLVDEPFALTTGINSLVIGSLEGRVYRVSMPILTSP
jgi:outer membrane protein assembly factor BamB